MRLVRIALALFYPKAFVLSVEQISTFGGKNIWALCLSSPKPDMPQPGLLPLWAARSNRSALAGWLSGLELCTHTPTLQVQSWSEHKQEPTVNA